MKAVKIKINNLSETGAHGFKTTHTSHHSEQKRTEEVVLLWPDLGHGKEVATSSAVSIAVFG